ncbi:hypothetical protein KRP22_003565 [Phytophthora ramorum]|nr:putative E3 ubiquitin-protein ligase LOG2 [Phytophthora ramorum]
MAKTTNAAPTIKRLPLSRNWVALAVIPAIVALVAAVWTPPDWLQHRLVDLIGSAEPAAAANATAPPPADELLVDKYESEVVTIDTHPLLVGAQLECPDVRPTGEGLTHVELVLGQKQQLQAQDRVFFMLNGQNEGIFLPWIYRQDEDACLLELAQMAAEHLGADPDRMANGMKLFSIDGLPILTAHELNTQRIAHVLLDGQLWVWPGVKVGYVREIEGCTVTTQSLHPKVFTVEGFFSQEEADAIIAEGVDHLARSPVDSVDADDGYHADRTSFTAFLDDTQFTRNFRVRSARIARLPSPSYTERMQLVRYETGQFFRQHEDYFDSKVFLRSKQLTADEFEAWIDWAAVKIEELRQEHGDSVIPVEFLPGGAMFPDAQSTTIFHHALLTGFMEDAGATNFFWEHADVEWEAWINENLKREADNIMGPILESKGYMLPFIVKSWEHRAGLPELVYSFPKLPVSAISHYFRWVRWAKERVQTLLDTQADTVPKPVRPEGEDYPTFYMSFQSRLVGYILEDYSEELLVEVLTAELHMWLVENQDNNDALLEVLRNSPRAFDLVVEAWTKRAGSLFAYEKPTYLHHFEPNRFATLFLYLNDCPEGGETVFPYSKERVVTGIEREGMDECSEGLAVPPVKLTASFFYSQTPMNGLDPASLHGGCPPAKGLKYGANSFMWNADADEGANIWGMGEDFKEEINGKKQSRGIKNDRPAFTMGHTASVNRQRRSTTGTLYGEPAGAAAAPRGSYTPAQMQALYLSRGRPDMAFMSNQGRVPVDVPELQQTCTVKNHVNLKKASLKLQQSPTHPQQYALEFQFDATKPCRISVFLVATETVDADTGSSSFALVHEDKNPVLVEHFPSGLGQSFSLNGIEAEEEVAKEEDQEKHGPPLPLLDLSTYNPDEMVYKTGTMQYPLIIVLEVSSTRKSPQSQSTFCTFVKKGEDCWDIKMLKQKILVDGLTYELQEIYGIDGSVAAAPKAGGAAGGGQADTNQATKDEIEIPEGAECIICLCEPRNTTILPCRHMCLCSECAEALRKSSSTCPICRTNVEALLQIRVEAKETTTTEAEDDAKTEVEDSK